MFYGAQTNKNRIHHICSLNWLFVGGWINLNDEFNHIFQRNCYSSCCSSFLTQAFIPRLWFFFHWLFTDLLSLSSWSESDRQKASCPPQKHVQHALREKNSAFLLQPLYKLLTQRLWSVIEAAIFPLRLMRSALQEPITSLWWELAFHFS